MTIQRKVHRAGNRHAQARLELGSRGWRQHLGLDAKPLGESGSPCLLLETAFGVAKHQQTLLRQIEIASPGTSPFLEARATGEMQIAKARSRVKRIDRERSRAVAELRALQELRRTTQERLRSSLEALLQSDDDQHSTADLDADLVGRVDAAEGVRHAPSQAAAGSDSESLTLSRDDR